MAGNVPACESDNERLVTLMMIRWRGRGRGRVRFSHFNKVVAIFQTSGAFCYPGKSEAIYDLYAGGGRGVWLFSSTSMPVWGRGRGKNRGTGIINHPPDGSNYDTSINLN